MTGGAPSGAPPASLRVAAVPRQKQTHCPVWQLW